MFVKLLSIFALFAVALAQKYPSGLNPAVCPNYPFCDLEVVARHTPEGYPIPDWGLHPKLRAGARHFLPGARGIDKYPADLNPALCPNYPHCW